jgi:hypothetical protein
VSACEDGVAEFSQEIADVIDLNAFVVLATLVAPQPMFDHLQRRPHVRQVFDGAGAVGVADDPLPALGGARSAFAFSSVNARPSVMYQVRSSS